MQTVSAPSFLPISGGVSERGPCPPACWRSTFIVSETDTSSEPKATTTLTVGVGLRRSACIPSRQFPPVNRKAALNLFKYADVLVCTHLKTGDGLHDARSAQRRLWPGPGRFLVLPSLLVHPGEPPHRLDPDLEEPPPLLHLVVRQVRRRAPQRQRHADNRGLLLSEGLAGTPDGSGRGFARRRLVELACGVGGEGERGDVHVLHPPLGSLQQPPGLSGPLRRGCKSRASSRRVRDESARPLEAEHTTRHRERGAGLTSSAASKDSNFATPRMPVRGEAARRSD